MFEKYETTYTPSLAPDKLEVAIYRSGAFRLSRFAYQQIGCADSVDLFFDSTTHRIGIKPSTSHTAYSAKARNITGGAGFLKHYRIKKPERAITFPAEIIDGMLVFQVPAHLRPKK